MQKFRDHWHVGRSNVDRFSDASFVSFDFLGGAFPATFPLDIQSGQWRSIRNVELRDIGQENCSLTATALEDIQLHNLKRLGSDPLFLWCCVFRHVVLSGRVSALKINRTFNIGSNDGRIQKQWDRATLEFYEKTDWALDISAAKFTGAVSFEAIPGELIRRNPETQVLVRRSKLHDVDWQKLDFENTAIDVALSWFLSDSLFDSVVLAAQDNSKWKKREIAVLEMLRRQQIADPD